MKRQNHAVVTFPIAKSESKHSQENEAERFSRSYFDYLLELADRLLSRRTDDHPEAA